MKNIVPLFRWAGGKTKMLKHYVSILPDDYERYVEPFFGGGAMFLHIKSKNPRTKCFINDINPSIISIYESIRNDFDDFVKYLDILDSKYIPLSKEDRKKFYYDVRSEHAWNYQSWSKTKESSTFYFLLKTSFNGILQININTNNRFGTPAGLLNEKTSVYSLENLVAWNKILEDTIITSTDWKKSVKGIDVENTFFFFDPPYRGCFTSYGQTFTDEHQIELLEFCYEIMKHKGHVLFCNRDDGDNFWDNKEGLLSKKMIDVTYTAGRRKRENGSFLAKPAKEIAFHNISEKDSLGRFL